jgi:hypothetical protein
MGVIDHAKTTLGEPVSDRDVAREKFRFSRGLPAGFQIPKTGVPFLLTVLPPQPLWISPSISVY